MTSWPESMRSRSSAVAQRRTGDEQPGSVRAALARLKTPGRASATLCPRCILTPVEEVGCVEMGRVTDGRRRRLDGHNCRQGGGLVHRHHRRADIRCRHGCPYQSQQRLTGFGNVRKMPLITADTRISGMMESHAMTRAIQGQCITRVQTRVADRRVVC